MGQHIPTRMAALHMTGARTQAAHRIVMSASPAHRYKYLGAAAEWGGQWAFALQTHGINSEPVQQGRRLRGEPPTRKGIASPPCAPPIAQNATDRAPCHSSVRATANSECGHPPLSARELRPYRHTAGCPRHDEVSMVSPELSSISCMEEVNHEMGRHHQ